jgi:hypothetical protein
MLSQHRGTPEQFRDSQKLSVEGLTKRADARI